MTQQYQTLKYEMPRLHATAVSQKQINKICLKTLKPLLSKGRGRGEIGKHKGLKRGYITGLVTRVTPNSFNNNNNLIDNISVGSFFVRRDAVALS